MDAMLVDLDGTLFDVSGMRHYVTDDPQRKNFDAFHKSACLFAPVNPKVVHGMEMAKRRGWAVLIVTARKRQWGYYSKMALDKHRVPYDRIYMRENDDGRRDYEVKRDILARIRSQGFNVVWAWDDRPSIIQLWLENGIPCTHVPGWEYEFGD